MRTIIRSATAGSLVSFTDTIPPVPAGGQILVDVRAFSLNRGELGLLCHRPDGWRPGQDFTGTVVAAAASGAGPQLGERVTGMVANGSWAQQVAVDTDAVAVLPPEIDDHFAAALPLAGLTALRTLRMCGPLIGKRVLLTAGSGGVGQFQVQLLALAGARAVAVVRDDAVRRTMADAVPGVQFIGGLGEADSRFDVIVDSVGGESLGGALARLQPDAIVVSCGNSSGAPTPLSILDFIGAENVTLRTYFSYHRADPPALDLALLVRLYADQKLSLLSAQCRDWSDIESAIADLSSNGPKAKQILTL